MATHRGNLSMIVHLSFKTPDVMVGVPKDMPEADAEKLHALLGRFVRHGEYIKVEFDTEAGTCKVVENGK